MAYNTEKKLRLITITTDASFFHTFNVGSFAFWIKSDDFTIKKSGLFKNKVENCHCAEIQCILNAIYVIRNMNTEKVIINTDSKIAIDILSGKQNKSISVDYYTTFLSLSKNKNISLRHVKGHTRQQGAKYYVNDWCDNEAKKHSRKEIERILKLNN